MVKHGYNETFTNNFSTEGGGGQRRADRNDFYIVKRGECR